MDIRTVEEGAVPFPRRLSRRPEVVTALAGAAIAGPILFTALVIVQGLLQPDYSHAALPISALAAWPAGWVQNVNFVVFGALMIAYAAGLHLGVQPGRGGATGPALLVLSGIGLVVAGCFPWRAGDGDFAVPPGHIAGALLSFLGGGSGLIVLSRRLADDPHWRSLATYALATGVAMVLLFFVMFALVRLPDAPPYLQPGVLQRVLAGVWFVCTLVLASRLRRVARAPAAAP